MLIEVKVKVSRIIDAKTRKRTETFLIPDCELFVNAEHQVMQSLAQEQQSGVVEEFEIQSLRISPIREICPQFQGENTFIATLKDIFHDDNGNEKPLKYKVLLWANNLTQANQHIQQLSHEGYDMQVEGIKQVDYEYLTTSTNEQFI